jgi:hypothetical protein
MESDLAALCWLYQGLPNGVIGSSFVYAKRESQDCEAYLVNLIDAPKPRQKALRDVAVFLARRVYRDNRENECLVLDDSDALRLTAMLRLMKSDSLALKDRLLRDAIACYLELSKDRAMAQNRWLKSENGINAVRANVKKVLAKLVITRKVETGWIKLGIYR